MKKYILLLALFGIVLISAEIAARLHEKKHPLRKRVLHGEPYTHDGNPGRWDERTDHLPRPSWSGARQSSPTDDEDGMEPHVLTYNSLAMRGPEPVPSQKPGVLLLGDSFVEADEIPFEKTMGERMNKKIGPDGPKVYQQGYTSWSPITEFAWFLHYGETLNVNQIYLFVYENDFYSRCALNKADQGYRVEYVFNGTKPDYMPRRRLSFSYKHSALVRFVQTGIIPVFYPRVENFIRLAKDSLPLSQKYTLLMNRIRHGTPIYPPPCPENYPNPSKLFLKEVADLDTFLWDNRLMVEEVLLRLPESEWDDTLRLGIASAMKSIADFSDYLKERKIGLTVVYTPASADIDRPAQNENGLQPYLTTALEKARIPFINLTPLLRAEKKKHCPTCPKYFYLKNNDHWNGRAHEVVAEILLKDIKKESEKTINR